MEKFVVEGEEQSILQSVSWMRRNILGKVFMGNAYRMVELLSREGEIAIAKRIEAWKDVMINALTQSPIVGKKIFEWKEQIENQQLLV